MRELAGDAAWITLFVALFEILSFGAIIVLVVLGLGIIASMMGIFNFAQGEFVLLGAYITYLVYGAGVPVWVGMVAAPVRGRRARLRAGASDHPPLLRRADRRDARHLCARADHPRDRTRPDRRALSSRCRSRSAARSIIGAMHFSTWRLSSS